MVNPLGSVRARTTGGAVVVVGVALVAASISLVTIMQRAMENNIRDAARLVAHDLTTSLEDGRSPLSLNLGGGNDDVVVQVLDSSGRIVQASPKLQGDPVLAELEGRESQIVDPPPVGEDDPFVVIAATADTPEGRVTLLVGRNLDLVVDATATITKILAWGMPFLLLVVGVTTWAVVGRSLAPVESMRKEVSHISMTQLHRRVPELPGDDEVARLARTMNEMLARVDHAQHRQHQLVSDASHELRNPIAAIRHHAEVALAHGDRMTLEGLASAVLAEDIRLQHLAEDLLLLARADEHTLLGSNSRPIDLDDLVLEEARRLKETTKLRVDTRAVRATRTSGDGSQLKRVVRNLADNAARHASSVVRFALHETNGRVVLEVDDDGSGVPPNFRAVVFERFTRLDDARDRAHGGAGLGLAIVAEVVAAHGGTAAVTDAPLGGARFWIELPKGS